MYESESFIAQTGGARLLVGKDVSEESAVGQWLDIIIRSAAQLDPGQIKRTTCTIEYNLVDVPHSHTDCYQKVNLTAVHTDWSSYIARRPRFFMKKVFNYISNDICF